VSRCALLVAIAAVCVAMVAETRSAAAQVPARVALDFEECPAALDGDRLEAILRVELTADGVEEVVRGAGRVDEVLAAIRITALLCVTDATELVITIDDHATQKSVQRTISVARLTGEARLRALALSTAELLRASWSELATPDAPEPARPVPLPVRSAVLARIESTAQRGPEPPAPLPTPPSSPPQVSPRETEPFEALVVIDASAMVRSFPSASTALVGGSVGLSVPLGSLLRGRLDIDAAHGVSLDRLGRIELTLVGAALAVGPTAHLGQAELTLLARAFVGWARAAGTPYDPSTRSDAGSDAILLLTAGAHARVPIVDAFAGSVDVEVGGAVAGLEAHASGRAVAGVLGATLAVRVGVGWAL
jgi:hypothetical protein